MANNVKNSIRGKYNRRQVGLYYLLQDYLQHAEDRLNKEIAGTARDREKIEEIVQKCKELLDVVPVPEDEFQDIDIDLDSILKNSNIDAILEQGINWNKELIGRKN